MKVPLLTSLIQKATKTVIYGVGDVNTIQVEPMLKRFKKVYEEGDSVYVIGFSRGSASARLFSNRILSKGIVPEIEFLGCFETVLEDILINPDQQKRNEAGFEPSAYLDGKEWDGQLHKNINQAVHCVALDDDRFHRDIKDNGLASIVTMAPTLMGQSEKVTEVWFPGQHGSIGGGFYRKEVSDVALEYMKDWLQNLGEGKSLDFLKPEDVEERALKNSLFGWRKKFENNKATVKESLSIVPKATGIIPYEGWESTRYVKAIKNDKTDSKASVKIHESLLSRLDALDNYVVNKYLGTDLEESLPLDRIEVITSKGNVSEEKTNDLRSKLGK